MGNLLAAYLFPHPPIIIEEIGRGEENKARDTLEGCKMLARDIGEKKPDTIVVITPHGPLFSDAISISVNEKLRGDFRNFGERSLSFQYKNNIQAVNKIIDKSKEKDIPLVRVDENLAENYNVSLELDHGTLVPLYFVDKEYKGYKLIHITYGLLSPKDLYVFGKIIQEVLLELKEKAVLIASGDLSHKLSNEGPYSYSPHGEKYDKEIVDILAKGDFKSLVSFDLGLCEKAGECALRSLMILAGFLDGYRIEPEVLSYQGPFGVGYCNAKFIIRDRDDETNRLEDIDQAEDNKILKARSREDEYVRLARKSLEHYVRYGQRIEPPKDLSEELLKTRQGAFVTLKKHGSLRGCIGTIEPVRENLAKEIIENAISAGLKDPRFESLKEEELSEIVYSVDVLKEAETISSPKDLDVERYGVIVSKGFRKGLLLPNIEGVDSPEDQIRIALNKAGIGPREDYQLERFEVIRHF